MLVHTRRLVLAAAVTGTLIWGAESTSVPRAAWESTAIAPVLIPSTVEQQLIQDAFNTPNFIPIDQPGGPRTVTGFSETTRPIGLYPTARSNAIFIGTVLNHDALLSTDKTRIVSELHIHVNTLLKDDQRLYQDGDTINIAVPGGAVRLPDGRVVTQPVAADHVSVGGRYLFFLAYNPSTRYFVLLRAWGLSANGTVTPCNVAEVEALNAQTPALSVEALLSHVERDLKQ